MSPPGNDADRRKRHFERRVAAAREGRHLPSLDELLCQSPFMSDSVGVDAQAFAERVLPRINDDGSAVIRNLRAALEAMTIDPDAEDFVAAYDAFLAVRAEARPTETKRRVPDPNVSALRCAYYAAASGCRDSAWRVAAEAISRAFEPDAHNEDMLAYTEAAVSWLLFASGLLPTANDRNSTRFDFWVPLRQRVHKQGRQMFTRIEAALRPAAANPVAETEAPPKASTRPRPAPGEEQARQEKASAGDGIVVFQEIGSRDTSEGKRVLKEYEPLLGVALDLTPIPNLPDARCMLVAEFPHAATVIDAVLTEIGASANGVRFRPTLFVGPPGCGKTTFASTLFSVLGVRHEIYPCGGVSDPALAGTPRRWSTGEPSLPVELAKRWTKASPGIVVDEIEKVATSRHNGNLLDALLGLLEPQSSARWHDPYIEAPVDLSRVLWLATANSLSGLPAALRDRCRIVSFPEPSAEHLAAIASALLRQTMTNQGLDQRWAAPFDGEEMDALRRHWPGGSVRRLARLVEVILAARGRERGVQ